MLNFKMLDTLKFMENTDSKQNYFNALWPKNTWNPGACSDLNTTDRKGKTSAPCC